MPIVRPEQPSDLQAIQHVLVSAFPTSEEAELVKKLRREGHLTISLVAEEEGEVIGYIAFSPVSVEGHTGGLGLGPVAVLPDHQSLGVGCELVQTGIEAAQATGVPYVVVLGHSSYYPRFGFKFAHPLGYDNEYDADESFMILELKAEGLPPRGVVKYGAEFAAWS